MVGQQLGNYRVTRKIGDGGMGSVFEAVHEGIGRRVAVKVLHPAYSQDTGVLQRFFNEARAVNIVQQPGIVGVFDYGQLPDGRAYLIMEFLEGETLGARNKRLGRLGLDALRVGRQIAATLAAAHAKGITHRDLKPDNVVMVPDSEAPGGERAKVLDFGIAKITTEHQSDHDGTQAGTVMGTPKYMAPEQCAGLSDVGPKADVYALGVVLFELLTGRLPFVSDSPGALLAAHRHKAPPSLLEIDPSAPPQVDALVQAMLAKDPATRPHMTEVAASLEYLAAWLGAAVPVYASGPVMAPPTSGGYGAVDVYGAGQYPQFGPRVGSLPPAATTPVSTGVSHPGNTGSLSRPSLSGMAGQSQPARPVSRLIVPSALSLVAFAAALFGLREVQHHRAPRAVTSSSSAASSGAALVRWQVQSQPAGAQVVRLSDDKVLGQTPLNIEQGAGVGIVALVLRKDGFFDQQVRLDAARDQSESVTLDPVPGAAPAAKAPPSAAASARPAPAAEPADKTDKPADKPVDKTDKPAEKIDKPAEKPADKIAEPAVGDDAKGKSRHRRSRKKGAAAAQETPKDDDTDLAPIR